MINYIIAALPLVDFFDHVSFLMALIDVKNDILFAGNDLARVLRWGSGYSGDEDPLSLLRDVIEAEEIRLDRWTVVFR